MKYNRRKFHEYLGTTFNFAEKAKVKINMDEYFEIMIKELPNKTSKSDTDSTPAVDNFSGKGKRKRMGKKN